MSWNQGTFVKNCQFKGILNLFNINTQADLSSIDRIKTSYRAIEGVYPQLPKLDNLLFFCPIGWFLINLSHKNAQNQTFGRIFAWQKIGLLFGCLPQPRIKFTAVWDSEFLASKSGRPTDDLLWSSGRSTAILGVRTPGQPLNLHAAHVVY